MGDKELLELAAKAVGIDLWWYGDEARILVNKTATGLWNPLTDDGDALRLAIKFGLYVEIGYGDLAQTRVLCMGEEISREPHGQDKYASTRRAIVRAVAEIGRFIKK